MKCLGGQLPDEESVNIPGKMRKVGEKNKRELYCGTHRKLRIYRRVGNF